MSKYSVLMYVDNTDNLSIQKLGVSKICSLKKLILFSKERMD